MKVHLRLIAEMRPLVCRAALPTGVRMILLAAMTGEPVTRLIEAEGEARARECLHAMLDDALTPTDD